MSIQIEMNKSVSNHLDKMVNEVSIKTIEKLAEIYNFDAEEAKEKVGIQVSTKKTNEKIKKIKTPSVLLPFCGEVNDDWCCGIRVNSGLYSQCTMKKITGDEGARYCKTCFKQAEKNDTNKPNYGDIEERLSKDYKPAKGKLLKFSEVAAKKNISRDEAEKEAAKYGWTIPEEEFEEVIKKSRKKKEATVSDTESESSTQSEKKPPRGRPKFKRVVKNDENENEKKSEKKKKSKSKKRDQVEKILNTLDIDDTSSDSDGNDAKGKSKKNKTKSQNKTRRTTQSSPPPPPPPPPSPPSNSSMNGEEESKGGDENTIEKEEIIHEVNADKLLEVKINGKQYLVDTQCNNEIFDKETKTCVGFYDSKNNTIKSDDESDDESVKMCQLSDVSDSDSDSDSDSH